MNIASFARLIEADLQHFPYPNTPRNLYEPVAYIMGLGGKRIRPLLTLMGCDLFGGSAENALAAARGVEIFHNFTLVHDDIMDQAPLRRGHETVHEKWDTVTGILSGDAMVLLAYAQFNTYAPDTFKALIEVFTRTGQQICEGQQWDMDFEKMELVPLDQYLHMIAYKTAVLVGAALEMGAIVAGATATERSKLYEFGLQLGLAFQIQDDYLDAFGPADRFGKQVGGDIMANKKTYLYLTALQMAQPEERRQLLQLYSIAPDDNAQKIAAVKAIFEQSGAVAHTREAIAAHTQRALEVLAQIEAPSDKLETLRSFALDLMERQK